MVEFMHALPLDDSTVAPIDAPPGVCKAARPGSRPPASPPRIVVWTIDRVLTIVHLAAVVRGMP